MCFVSAPDLVAISHNGHYVRNPALFLGLRGAFKRLNKIFFFSMADEQLKL